jgi:predicted DNA-binding transcriptional regulator YafY
MKLQDSLKGLIYEIAAVDDVVNSIKQRQKVVIYYDGDEPGGRGLREIEPVALGVSKAGNKILRAWDMEGSSHTAYKGEQPLPGWRIFRLDKILSIKPTGEIYNEPKPGYNFNGDKSMTSVIINAKFDNTTPTATPSPATPTPTPTPTQQQNIT